MDLGHTLSKGESIHFDLQTGEATVRDVRGGRVGDPPQVVWLDRYANSGKTWRHIPLEDT